MPAVSRFNADLGEIDAQMAELQERKVTAEARFEELDMQLADSQERHAQLDDRVIEAERKLNESREQQRALERQSQEAQFALRSVGLSPRRADPFHRHRCAAGRLYCQRRKNVPKKSSRA